MTEAVLVIIPCTVGSTTMSTVAVAPFPIVPRLHVTVPPDSLHDPWLGVAERKVTVDGSWSVTLTPDDASGPLFATVIV